MNNTVSTTSVNPFANATYVVLLAGLGGGLATMHFGLHWALLPAAVIFGWSQIGGL
jgi:hypothetical protein